MTDEQSALNNFNTEHSETTTDGGDELTPHEQEALEKILALAEEMGDQFRRGEIPSMTLPTRTKSNIIKNDEIDAWVYGDRTSTRTANKVRGAKKLLKSLYAGEFLANQIQTGRSSTLRELYYISESWDNSHAHFESQDESDSLIEDVEIVTGVRRENFHMRPEESGATLIGPLKLREQTRGRGSRDIHCQEDVGEGGYQIPNNPDTIEFLEHDMDFVLAVETGGMRDRLVENGFDTAYNAMIAHLKGQPARATRRIIKRMHDELGVPVVVFTDGDPWSYRIFASVAYGSIKSAHLSRHLATPEAQFVGVQPRDIVEYDLPSDPLGDSDINALESILDDPRFASDYWQNEVQTQLDIGQKSEQQALASYGLDFVSDTYLPERLEEMGIIN